MLKKEELKQIQEVVNNSIFDFWDKILNPYLTQQFGQNEKEHREIQEDIDIIQRKLEKHTQKFNELESPHKN